MSVVYNCSVNPELFPTTSFIYEPADRKKYSCRDSLSITNTDASTTLSCVLAGDTPINIIRELLHAFGDNYRTLI